MRTEIPDSAISLDQYIGYWMSVDKDSRFSVNNIERYSINGKSAISYNLNPSPNGLKTNHVFIKDSDRVYSFVYIEYDLQVEEIIKNIIKTFVVK